VVSAAERLLRTIRRRRETPAALSSQATPVTARAGEPAIGSDDVQATVGGN
jgi:hypothetical protein